MKNIARAITVILTLLLLAACAANTGEEDSDHDGEIDDLTASEAVGTSSEALVGSFCATPEYSSSPGYLCAAPFAGRKSSNTCFMFPAARAALARAGVPASDLTQTFGDARASAGTHCPEPGTWFSAATDMAPGYDTCSRVRRLRAQGFAAWYRGPPMGVHIHAVYAGANSKPSLGRQVDSFLAGNNGLASNTYDSICPITATEKAAVSRVRGGGSANAGGGGGSGSGNNTACYPNGYYCGGNKVAGDSRSLYRCNASGTGAALVQACAGGCSVNAGTHDSCN